MLSSRYRHFAAGIILLLSLIVFFSPIIFENKTFLGYDAVASLSWSTVLKEAGAEGIVPLWNPYIFCGMPGYASVTFAVQRTFDITT